MKNGSIIGFGAYEHGFTDQFFFSSTHGRPAQPCPVCSNDPLDFGRSYSLETGLIYEQRDDRFRKASD